MISNESYQLIHGLLGSRRDQEACNVKNALKSEGYKRGNQTMVEYVAQKRKSVQLCQQAIDELKDAREKEQIVRDADRETMKWTMTEEEYTALRDAVCFQLRLIHEADDMFRRCLLPEMGIEQKKAVMECYGRKCILLAGALDKITEAYGFAEEDDDDEG